MLMSFWQKLALVSIVVQSTYGRAVPVSFGDRVAVEASAAEVSAVGDDLAESAFGSLRALPLEKMYAKGQGAYSSLRMLNQKLLGLKKAVKSNPKTYYEVRDEYNSNNKLQDIIPTIPKGNYAHLHFNAYLTQPEIEALFKEAQDKYDLFKGEDVSPFTDTMKEASEPYGDLLKFPDGPLEKRADEAWPLFQAMTPKFKVPFMYEKFWRMYLQKMFTSWTKNGLLHGELRHVFMQESIINEQGKKITDVDEAHKLMLDIVRDEVQKFRKENDQFVGAKVIYCIPRMFTPKEDDASRPHWSAEWSVNQYLKLAQWEKENRDDAMLVAFDVVGREDAPTDASGAAFKPTSAFKDQLSDLLKEGASKGLPANLALHAGEGLDMHPGKMPRQNLELLGELGSKFPEAKLRGAHLVGFAHTTTTNGSAAHGSDDPQDLTDLLEDFDRLNIGAELCPISNEGLGTSLDATYSAHHYTDKLMETLSSSISGDDPTYWGNTPSLELAYAFFGSDKVDLYRMIALAHMSINTSYMTAKEMQEAYQIVEKQVKALRW